MYWRVDMQISTDQEFNFPLEDCPFCDKGEAVEDVRSNLVCTHNFTITDYYSMGQVIEEIKQDLATLEVAHKQMIKIITKETTGIDYQ